jgi:chloramphenicol O-acetyltransferase type A
MFKEIDLESWSRKATFGLFREYDDPFFNITANVDVAPLYTFCKTKGLLFSLACVFFSQQTANGIREFRLRLMDGRVVEFDRIHASQTILNDDDTFSFSYLESAETVEAFDKSGKAARDRYRELKTFDVAVDRIDLIYYSVIPWISFTAFKHAVWRDPAQSVPRIVFGKVFPEGGSLQMPVSVEVHHALVDGLHVGRYFQRFQETIAAL